MKHNRGMSTCTKECAQRYYFTYIAKVANKQTTDSEARIDSILALLRGRNVMNYAQALDIRVVDCRLSGQ